MNLLQDRGYISELICGANFSYILNDNSYFLSTEYKVLQNQVDSCFVKCMKMLYNNKVQLYYITSALKPFSAMLPTLSAESFMKIAKNLLSDIIDVKNNGFISCQKIDISLEHIYVDPANYKVKLIYLPISKKMYISDSVFENEFRTGLVKMISDFVSLASPDTMRFSDDLQNGTLSLEDIHKRMKVGSNHDIISQWTQPDSTAKLHIVADDAPTRIEIDVNKDDFVIGKKAQLVDAAVSFNKMISRVHCKINTYMGKYSITDLESANGTFVNGIRLKPNVAYPIKDGDVIRLANSNFHVMVK